MDGRGLLQSEFLSRRGRNPSYSLRAFARDLRISPASLSQFFSKKRDLSKKNIESIIDNLQLTRDQEEILSPTVKKKRMREIKRNVLDESTFRLISDWKSLAIINLAKLKSNRGNAKWVSDRLGITVAEASEVLGLLVELKFIQIKSGRMIRTIRPFTTSQDVPSASLKKYHSSVIRKAEAALFDVPVGDRDITAIVIPTNMAKLAEAKKLIEKFRYKILDLLNTDGPNEVFALSVQLFPLTKIESSSK